MNRFGLVSFHFNMICSYKLWMVWKVEHKEHLQLFLKLFYWVPKPDHINSIPTICVRVCAFGCMKKHSLYGFLKCMVMFQL